MVYCTKNIGLKPLLLHRCRRQSHPREALDWRRQRWSKEKGSLCCQLSYVASGWPFSLALFLKNRKKGVRSWKMILYGLRLSYDKTTQNRISRGYIPYHLQRKCEGKNFLGGCRSTHLFGNSRICCEKIQLAVSCLLPDGQPLSRLNRNAGSKSQSWDAAVERSIHAELQPQVISRGPRFSRAVQINTSSKGWAFTWALSVYCS